jgi:hypothetical protein
MMLAVVGAEQAVPDTDVGALSTTMTKFVACVKIPGYARPEVLKCFVTLACVVSVVSYLLTAVSW